MAATATMMLILITFIFSIDYYIRVYHTPLCIVRQHPALFCKEE